jgi:hypothetical protein
MVEPSENEHGEKSQEEKIDIFGKFFIVFCCMLYIVLSTGVILKMINYILEKSDEIIELSFTDLLKIGFNYLKNYDYNTSIFYTMVLTIILLMFYLTIIFIYSDRLEQLKIKIIIFLILYFFSLCVLDMEEIIGSENKKLVIIIILFFLSVILLKLSEKFLNKLVKFNRYSFSSKIKSFLNIRSSKKSISLKIKNLIKNEANKIIAMIMKQRVRLIIIIFSFFSYTVICFLFEGSLSNIFNVHIIMILFLGGVFIYGIVIEQIVLLSKEIVTQMIRPKSSINYREMKFLKLIITLRSYTFSLLIDFFIVIVIFLFIRALLAMFPFGISPFLMNILNDILLFILLIPFYIFLIKTVSEIIKIFVEEIYNYIEMVLLIPQNELRKNILINTLDRIIKIGITSLIILDIFSRYPFFPNLISLLPRPPFNYIIVMSAASPILTWILVLMLDPFFVMGTIRVGTSTGKIKNIGFFFTQLETLTGEHVYIPNAKLLAKIIMKLNVSVVQKKNLNSKRNKSNGKGIIITFTCPLNHDHKPESIKFIFNELFEDENKISSLKEYLNKAGFDLSKGYIEDILSEPCQFVSIEEFKDHEVVYGFNFRIKDSFYAPLFRSYFMLKFIEKLGAEIKIPVKSEIINMNKDDFT